MMLTDRELQTLRNMGNEAEAAADEIVRLQQHLGRLRHDFAQAVKLADDRLEQMKADRAQALRWNEGAIDAERLRAALRQIADHDVPCDIGWRHWKDMARDALGPNVSANRTAVGGSG